MNKKKTFNARNSQLNELRLFSALPLEAAKDRIQRLDAKYEVQITPEDADSYAIQLLHNKPGWERYGVVNGTLRRWEGTYTRLECKGEARKHTHKQRPDEERQKSHQAERESRIVRILLANQYSIALTIIIGSTFGILVTLMLVQLVSPAGMLIFILVVMLGGLLWNVWISTFGRVLLHPRDELLDALRASLSADGVIAYSPEELSTKMAALSSEQPAENTSYE